MLDKISGFYYTISLFILTFLSTSVLGQPSKLELKEYLQNTYKQQLNITSLPDTFFDCAYRVFNYNYNKSSSEPQKDIGDECLFPVLENNLDDIDFSDRGRKLYQVMKKQLIQSCAAQTISTVSQCTCAHEFYDSKGLGYLDIVSEGFEASEIKKQVKERCKDE